MKKIEFNVQEPYYSFIKNGQKITEGRLNKGKFAEIEIGDILLLGLNQQDKNREEYLVTAKNKYKTFYEMMEKEGLENVLPDKSDIQNGVNTVYYKFYSPEKEKEFGVLAIQIEKNKK